MKAILAIALLVSHPIAQAFDDNCDGTPGSTYVEACNLSKSIDEMDKQLNTKYQKVLNTYKKDKATNYARLLVEAQRAWIRYRDRVCEFEDQAFGGINSISWARCKARITEIRLKEFNEFGAD